MKYPSKLKYVYHSLVSLAHRYASAHSSIGYEDLLQVGMVAALSDKTIQENGAMVNVAKRKMIDEIRKCIGRKHDKHGLREFYSLNVPVTDDQETTFQDILVSEEEFKSDIKMDLDRMHECIDLLSSKDRLVITKILEGVRKLDIAKMVNVSATRITQLEKEIIRKMRSMMDLDDGNRKAA